LTENAQTLRYSLPAQSPTCAEPPVYNAILQGWASCICFVRGRSIGASCHGVVHKIFNKTKAKVGCKMGAILDLVEKMRSPMGIAVTLAIVVIGFLFVRWVFNDQDKPQ
jgi:hypothetical protein